MSGLKLQIKQPEAGGFALKVDIELPDHGITAIYGPSGSGKTTLLNCIAGLHTSARDNHIVFRGEVWSSEDNILPAHRRRIGYVFQDARLFPHLNVQQNLEYALNRRRGHSAIEYSQVVNWLELTDLLQQSAHSLSAGQAQRVAIARALLSAPQLLVLDEPLANLDRAARQQCIRCLQTLRDSLDLPMLYVSHDIEEVSQLAEHIVLLTNGTVEDQGSVLELSSRLDTSLSLEEPAAAIALATVVRHDIDFGLTELELEGHSMFVNHLPETPGQQRRVRIPARDVSICRERPSSTSILNILPVTLSAMMQSDEARLLLRLQIGEPHLLARLTRKSAAQLNLIVGDSLYAQIKSAALLSDAVNSSHE